MNSSAIEKQAPTVEIANFLDLWKSHMNAVGDAIDEGILRVNIIDTEKVNAYLGKDGAMIIDDNALVLPPTKAGE
jgi:hypothetical protein